MNPSTINIIVIACLILLSMTFIDSIIIMIGGKKLFKKAQKNEKSAMYPIANLFTVLEITEMSTFYGILFFVPVVNCVILSIMFYKLGNVFSTSMVFKIGLVLLPIVFFPILASSDKQYKLADEEYLLKLDSAKDYSINLLSDEELKEKFKDTEEVKEEPVDSIFKSEVQMMEEVAPYKAKRNDFIEIENSDKEQNDKQKDNIEFVELDENNKYKKEEKMEIIDL